QGRFEFLGEKSFWQTRASLRERGGLQFVAGGFDDFQLKPAGGKCQPALGEHGIRLRERERTAPGVDENRFMTGRRTLYGSLHAGSSLRLSGSFGSPLFAVCIAKFGRR